MTAAVLLIVDIIQSAHVHTLFLRLVWAFGSVLTPEHHN